MSFIIILRWIGIPIVSFAITYTTLLVVSLLIPSYGYPYEVPIFGSIGAFTLVVSVAFVAPNYIKIIAVLHFIIGVLISWRFLSSLTEPDSVTVTYVPMFFSYLSGAIGLLTVFLVDRTD